MIWNRHEGDAGATFVTGNNPDMQRCAEAAKTVFDEVAGHWRNTGCSGIALYGYAAKRAEAHSWRLNVDIKGHRVSDFPHAIYKAGNLADYDAQPAAGLWVLEIQIAHPTRAFYEVLIVIHHLVVDGVSWRVLLEALQALYERPDAALPAITTPLSVWTSCQRDYAQQAERLWQLAWWQRMLHGATAALPLEAEGEDEGDCRLSASRVVTLQLPADATQRLLQRSARADGVRTGELLLAALAQTLGPWSGAARLLIDLDGHGREDLIDGVDLSRSWIAQHAAHGVNAAERAFFEHACDVILEHGRIVDTFRMPALRTPLTLWWSTESAESGKPRDWSARTGASETVLAVVPAGHTSIMHHPALLDSVCGLFE